MTFEIIIVAALVLLGILFMLAEFFLLPGISIAGIAGVIFLLGGIVYAYLFLGSTTGNLTLAAAAIAMGASFFWLLKSKSLRKIALETNIDSRVDNSDLRMLNVGDTGITLSRLNPTGKVLVNDLTVEGKSLNGEFIDEEEEVVRIDGYQVQVRRIDTAGIN